ncbi:MAG: hypothetical protein U0R19_32190 [Bryobacteraceae bacterium]
MKDFYRPPRFHRYFLTLVASLVPSPQRRQWRTSNSSVLSSLWTLIQRGEFPRDAHLLLAAFCRDCFRGALFTRFSPRRIVAAAGHPALPFGIFAGLLLLTALVSGGLPTLSRLYAEFGTATDFFVAHAFVLTLAAAIALHAVLNQPNAVHGWLSALFLGAKTILGMVALTCVWMESAAALHRFLLPHEPWWILSRLFSTLLFLFASGWAMLWCVSDQRQRCPTCLHRLATPVSLGSWASVFDPATTILVCPQGHGSLSAPETQLSPSDQWTNMDASWSLFIT